MTSTIKHAVGAESKLSHRWGRQRHITLREGYGWPDPGEDLSYLELQRCKSIHKGNEGRCGFVRITYQRDDSEYGPMMPWVIILRLCRDGDDLV